MDNRRETDVVVCGAGMAGLCASLTALERGARVLTLEKGNRAGGSMLLSGGLIWTFADKSQLRDEMPGGDPVLQDVVVDGLDDGLTWLEEQGVPLRGPQRFMWYGRGRSAAPDELTSVLLERIVERGGDVVFNTGIESLRGEVGAVCGVEAVGPNGALSIEAASVVLATGGFQGNAELLTRYVTPHAESVYLRANPWSTGDGFLAATEVGAAVTPSLGAFYGHALAAPPARFTEHEFLDVTQRYGPVAVALNLDGERFTDESAGTGEEALNLAVAAQREATAVYIFDAVVAEISHHGGALPRVTAERLRERGGPVLGAATLPALCSAMAVWGVPPARALATLEEYNAALTARGTETLHPQRLGNCFPMATPPFTAVLVRAGITFTCGGLAVDPEMRVLRRATSASTLPLARGAPDELTAGVIPGLYAAGCDVGNVSAGGGYLGGLATALTTGRIAGGDAARWASRMLEGVGNRVDAN